MIYNPRLGIFAMKNCFSRLTSVALVNNREQFLYTSNGTVAVLNSRLGT